MPEDSPQPQQIPTGALDGADTSLQHSYDRHEPTPISDPVIKPEADPYFGHLSFEGIFAQVIRIFRQRYGVFLGITFLTYIVGWGVALIAAYLLGADLQIDGFSVSVSTTDLGSTSYYGDEYQTPSMQLWQLFLYWIESGIYYCFLCIAHGASVWLAAHLYLHQYPTWMDAFRQAAKNVVPLVGSLLLIAFIISVPVFIVVFIIAYAQREGLMVLSAFLCMAYMTYLQIIFYHVYPAIMVEKLGAIESLKRSYYLTQDHRCFLLGVLVCWGMIRFLTGMILASLAMSGGHAQSWQWYLSKSCDTMFGILYGSIESIFQAVLYIRNRVVKEQLDRVTLAANLGSDVLSSDENDNYVVMGAADDYDHNNNGGDENDSAAKHDADSKKVENLVELGVVA